MTEPGSDHPERAAKDVPAEELDDLDVPDDVEVTGGSTAITIKATGEKQGGPKG
jgi:hypothetical protein